jgi:hypothetical protein
MLTDFFVSGKRFFVLFISYLEMSKYYKEMLTDFFILSERCFVLLTNFLVMRKCFKGTCTLFLVQLQVVVASWLHCRRTNTPLQLTFDQDRQTHCTVCLY